MPTHHLYSTSHLLSTGYQPVSEEVTLFDLPVHGRLPAELDGTLLRIGPNTLGDHDPARDHAFAGDGMVHGLRLHGGKVAWYRNRWLRTDRVARALRTLPTPGPRHGLSDNANANVVHHAGRTLALGDGGVLPIRLGPELDSLERFDFDGTLSGGFSAHPLHDPLTGELHAVTYEPGRPGVDHVTLDATGRVRRRETITVKGTPMMHAFSLTERHVILYDLPVTYSARAAAAGSRVPYAWDEGHGARLGILPRDGADADVLWAEVDPCFVFHPVNAYEQGRDIVVDVVRHERAFDLDPLHPSESAPTLWRWTVDRLGGTVSEVRLSHHVEEFPRIDDRYSGSPYRYAFTVGVRPGEGAALAGPSLLRHDLATGAVDVHVFGPGRETGEAVFVPRHAAAPEADGWLLSLVHDRDSDRGELVVLDTADFAGPPVATVRLPVRIPHGLHAQWIAGR
ncbi:dioxygenase [Streptomyces sp. R302]|uniref:carotenoid oxygenase family protein n=1 Tax=unclassified Streptomyces TaxID=2593676 RepID=UPI00145C4A15|nr:MULTISPECIES: carotenoid oxygenase family protein [unclassified Streptomyces]NML50999.1 dioxygenase [Streptomyces sp. R301]NML81093.1 dioxygenase [Streptomyces sp. R302]